MRAGGGGTQNTHRFLNLRLQSLKWRFAFVNRERHANAADVTCDHAEDIPVLPGQKRHSDYSSRQNKQQPRKDGSDNALVDGGDESAHENKNGTENDIANEQNPDLTQKGLRLDKLARP